MRAVSRRIPLYAASLLATSLFTSNLYAAWYQTSVSIPAQAGDESQLRTLALMDASGQLLGYTGVSMNYQTPLVTSLSALANGDTQVSYAAGSPIRSATIVSTSTQQSRYTLTLRADITPDQKMCRRLSYSKPMSVYRFAMDDLTQASTGAIFNLDTDYPTVLERQLRQALQGLQVRSYQNTHIPADASGNWLAAVGEQQQVQYLLTGQLVDLTPIPQTGLSQYFSASVMQRNFAVNIQVFDSYNGEQVFQQLYRTEAQWPFERTARIDTRSANFWQSAYGYAIRLQTDQIAQDLDTQLGCSSTQARISAINGTRLTINIGARNGVRKGDTLKLLHTTEFIDQQGQVQEMFTPSTVRLTVTQVYPTHAILSSRGLSAGSTVQVGDLVTKS
ncbi:MAG: flagella assembly protein FlgT middle domain-containing protein [Plesiomonas sp.]|uniref:flagella assembly protein FlgT middle domain-containing protein n=1 Tax=Plesiomonas sp. TaxID=2486279 RepID=UPI003F2C6F8C